MLTRIFVVIIIVFISNNSSLYTQILEPVKWNTQVEKNNDTSYTLLIRADIEEGWHLYSQKNIKEGGPVPTKFTFEKKKGVIYSDPTIEPSAIEEFEEAFEMTVKYFEASVVFRQKVILTDSSINSISGTVEYMVCDDTRCLPPSIESFNFQLSGKKEKPVFENSIDKLDKSDTGTSDDGKERDETTGRSNASDGDGNRGLLTIFIIAFLSGFAALLTPCVFPMIPLTVSYFTKQSLTRSKGIRNAIIYGLNIIVIYVLLGSLVTLIFGADALNALSTNVWFNVIFFVLLVIFALSFLGAFEIVLPSNWGTKMDARADRGGMIGIFFMALALAIVSFSCTGPIVGTLLVQAASTGGVAPIVGMLGFSSAIAIPFTLFAAFPGWMNSLPKSGGWLNTVKAVLGFLELALAFKFLSNADLVLQLHLLERETFLVIWIAILGALSLYLFGKIKLPYDSPLPHISVGRLSLGMFVLAFTIYLIPGLWGAPLQWISGFPPPQQYSESPYGVGNSRGGATGSSIELPAGAELGPHDIPAFKDYGEGMAYAKKVNKPVLLDFTGYACVNCRKMEERVWSAPQVLQVLKNEIVLISLYVDDKRKLPEQEQYVSESTGKQIKTTGNKWSDFQITKYQANAQPYYVIMDAQGGDLNEPVGYTPDIDEYHQWLKQGISNFD